MQVVLHVIYLEYVYLVPLENIYQMELAHLASTHVLIVPELHPLVHLALLQIKEFLPRIVHV